MLCSARVFVALSLLISNSYADRVFSTAVPLVDSFRAMVHRSIFTRAILREESRRNQQAPSPLVLVSVSRSFWFDFFRRSRSLSYAAGMVGSDRPAEEGFGEGAERWRLGKSSAWV